MPGRRGHRKRPRGPGDAEGEGDDDGNDGWVDPFQFDLTSEMMVAGFGDKKQKLDPDLPAPVLAMAAAPAADSNSFSLALTVQSILATVTSSIGASSPDRRTSRTTSDENWGLPIAPLLQIIASYAAPFETVESTVWIQRNDWAMQITCAVDGQSVLACSPLTYQFLRCSIVTGMWCCAPEDDTGMCAVGCC